MHRVDVFEDRYGEGAHDRLTARLQQPCASFATIAVEFGVTRERVRQWHLDLFPDAPQGHQRRRLCQEEQFKRKLLADPLFRAFARDVRRHLGASRLTPIRGAAGFRLRRARIDDRLVVLRDLHGADDGNGGHPGAARRAQHARRSPRVWKEADFVYLRLVDRDFVFLPSELARVANDAPAAARTAIYQRYRNTFDALRTTAAQAATAAGTLNRFAVDVEFP